MRNMKVFLRNDISSPLDTSRNQAQASQMTKCSRDLGLLIDSQASQDIPRLLCNTKIHFR
jgi:hypothetical protein